MTRTGTLAAARSLDALFCITRVPTPGGLVELPVSWAEIERETGWARRVLESHGVGGFRGRVAMMVSSCEEAPLTNPFEQALLQLGLPYTGSDARGTDGFRIATYLRRLPVAAAFGIDIATVDALAAYGEVADLLGRPRLLFVRPEAVEPLRSLGLRPLQWVPVGPAVAVECGHRVTHLNGAEWGLDVESDGTVRLTSLLPRARAWNAEVVASGWAAAVGPCACGSPDPGLRLLRSADASAP
jgi:hypothetical protein